MGVVLTQALVCDPQPNPTGLGRPALHVSPNGSGLPSVPAIATVVHSGTPRLQRSHKRPAVQTWRTPGFNGPKVWLEEVHEIQAALHNGVAPAQVPLRQQTNVPACHRGVGAARWTCVRVIQIPHPLFLLLTEPLELLVASPIVGQNVCDAGGVRGRQGP